MVLVLKILMDLTKVYNNNNTVPKKKGKYTPSMSLNYSFIQFYENFHVKRKEIYPHKKYMPKQKNNIRMRKYHRIQQPGFDVQRVGHK